MGVEPGLVSTFLRQTRNIPGFQHETARSVPRGVEHCPTDFFRRHHKAGK
jgi:hypothetical protein